MELYLIGVITSFIIVIIMLLIGKLIFELPIKDVWYIFMILLLFSWGFIIIFAISALYLLIIPEK